MHRINNMGKRYPSIPSDDPTRIKGAICSEPESSFVNYQEGGDGKKRKEKKGSSSVLSLLPLLSWRAWSDEICQLPKRGKPSQGKQSSQRKGTSARAWALQHLYCLQHPFGQGTTAPLHNHARLIQRGYVRICKNLSKWNLSPEKNFKIIIRKMSFKRNKMR